MSVLEYAVITPARNEAENLERLFDSLQRQTQKPRVWIVVDNGSSDNTEGVLTELARRTGWIRRATAESSAALVRGGTVTRAFQAGLSTLNQTPDVVVKVDADVSFAGDYFERLLEAFEAEPDLGIASGICLERAEDGTWQPRFTTGHNAWGAARAYRRECLEHVLPLEERMGWDGIDSIKASLAGWETRIVGDLSFKHHRREGERDGSRVRAWAAQGRAAHYMGYRWPYLVVRALHHARREPAAVAMVTAFAAAALRREPQCGEARVREYLRRQQSLRSLPARRREARGESV